MKRNPKNSGEVTMQHQQNTPPTEQKAGRKRIRRRSKRKKSKHDTKGIDAIEGIESPKLHDSKVAVVAERHESYGELSPRDDPISKRLRSKKAVVDVPKFTAEVKHKTDVETPKLTAQVKQKALGEMPKLTAQVKRKADSGKASSKTSSSKSPVTKISKRKLLKKVELDGVEFHVGEDVYVKKFETNGAESESDSELEQCQICGAIGGETMLECDGCLGGFHLTCLTPPLESVPDDDWMCPYCEKGEKPPEVQNGQHRRHRSARERLLAGDLWAARIERMWREVDGTYHFMAHWFLIPEATEMGREPHNGKRELFRSNKTDENEMDSIVRHCYVMSPNDFKNSQGEGDDVFFCAYEYNEQWCKFKRIDYLDVEENWSEDSHDESYGSSAESGEDDANESGGPRKRRHRVGSQRSQQGTRIRAANKRHNFAGGIAKVGAYTIPDRVKNRPQTELERAKCALALSAIPTSLPCRERERKEVTAFMRDSVGAGEHCLGRCLYISGVPGTGKTATVLEVIKDLGSRVESGEIPPHRFVEINGLRLPSPEHAYTVLHEALTGQHVGWKRALQFLDERFSNAGPRKGLDARPCVILVDELDLLVTRNQSVLYNIFDWPSRPHSRLIIIGIANTMDLPERLLPRIASRMGMQRISFGPYTHKQLEEIISVRLTGVQVFDKQAAEFAARKVAAVSGDIRRALELCRRAVEVAEARMKMQSPNLDCPASNDHSTSDVVPPMQDMHQGVQANRTSVTMADVDAAISEMFEAPQIQMMRRSAKLAKIFLVAMVFEQRRTSMAETTFEKVALACSELCSSNGEENPDWDTLLVIGCKLGASKLVLCEPGARHRLQKLHLNFPCDDVSFALNKDKDTPWLAKYL